MAKKVSNRAGSHVILLSALQLILLASCGGPHQDLPNEAPPAVNFTELHPVRAEVEKRYPGSIEGRVNVDVKAQVTGYLDEIYVREGDYVQKGQSLFRIKGDVFNEQVRNSQAALEAAQASEETARIELEKTRPLVEGKVISEVQLKTAEAAYASAKAQVAQAKAALGSSQINAAFSLIKAPVSGYIGRIPNRVGNLVTASDATPLTTLSEIDQVYVYFSLSEAEYLSMQKERQQAGGTSSVELILADGTPFAHRGNLESASGNIYRSTGTIPLKAVFPNPDKLLRAGGSAKVILRRSLDSALTIPMGAVRDIQDRYFVFALTDSSKVAMKPIGIGGRSGNHYIVRSGLRPGEKIAVNRLDVLADGMPVTPAPATDSIAR